MTGSTRSLDLKRHLSSAVSGEVFTPDDDGYDAARAIWNAMIDHRPLAVVRAASMADVAPVVSYAVHENVPLAVRGLAWAKALEVYGEDTLRRLAAVKHQFDLDNVFRLNHNIPPLVPTA